MYDTLATNIGPAFRFIFWDLLNCGYTAAKDFVLWIHGYVKEFCEIL
jgi:hypothetical protein